MAHDPTKRMPEVHPGTPPTARIMLDLRIVRMTDKAYLVERTDVRDNGQAWLPRKIIGGNPTPSGFDTYLLHVPVWLYAKLREQV